MSLVETEFISVLLEIIHCHLFCVFSAVHCPLKYLIQKLTVTQIYSERFNLRFTTVLVIASAMLEL